MPAWAISIRASHPSPAHGLVRAWLILEELEGREVLSPTVYGPEMSPPPFPEGGSVVLVGDPLEGGSGFYVEDENDYGQTYTGDLIATNGVVLVDPMVAEAYGVTVANPGTPDVTLTGPLEGINELMAVSGFSFAPAPFFSGPASVSLVVPEPAGGEGYGDGYGQGSGSGSGTSGQAEIPLVVTPVATPPNVTVNPEGEIWEPSGPVTFPPGLISVAPFPDPYGSETVGVQLSLIGVDDPTGFDLSATSGVVIPQSPGEWLIPYTSQAQLQTTLDSLTLTPPSGFSGRVGLAVDVTVLDQAYFPATNTTLTDTADTVQFVPFRFFVGADVSLMAVSAREGQTMDLAGAITVTDPDLLPGDVDQLVLSVPRGTLLAGPAPASLSVSGSGTNTLTIDGIDDDINQFLATPGSLTFDPGSSFFSGGVQLTATVVNLPGAVGSSDRSKDGSTLTNAVPGPNPHTTTTTLAFTPVAEQLVPVARVAVTDQDTPVEFVVGLPAQTDTSGSESVAVFIDDVPAGAELNQGTNIGSGTWALTPADLSGLVFTPPPGEDGVFTLHVRVVVTKNATDLGLTDTAINTAKLPVVVVPPAISPQVRSRIISSVISHSELTPEGAPIGVGPLNNLGQDEASLVLTDHEDDAPPMTSIGLPPPPNDSRPGSVGVGALPGMIFGATPVASPSNASGQVSGVSSGRSLFSQAEPPLPVYVGIGDRHPLPPILPLDQTLPVAGFSDSGGDSLTLIDQLYRDAAGPSVTQDVMVTLLLPQGGDLSQDGDHSAVAVIAAPISPGPESDSTPSSPAPAEPVGPQWWLIATVAAGLAAVGWNAPARRWAAWVGRRIARLLTPPIPSQDSA